MSLVVQAGTALLQNKECNSGWKSLDSEWQSGPCLSEASRAAITAKVPRAQTYNCREFSFLDDSVVMSSSSNNIAF